MCMDMMGMGNMDGMEGMDADVAPAPGEEGTRIEGLDGCLFAVGCHRDCCSERRRGGFSCLAAMEPRENAAHELSWLWEAPGI